MGSRQEEYLLGDPDDTETPQVRVRVKQLASDVALKGTLRIGKVMAAIGAETARSKPGESVDAAIIQGVCMAMTDEDLDWLKSAFRERSEVWIPIKQNEDGTVSGRWAKLNIAEHLSIVAAAQWLMACIRLSFASFFGGGAIRFVLSDPRVEPLP